MAVPDGRRFQTPVLDFSDGWEEPSAAARQTNFFIDSMKIFCYFVNFLIS